MKGGSVGRLGRESGTEVGWTRRGDEGEGRRRKDYNDLATHIYAVLGYENWWWLTGLIFWFVLSSPC
jgi:hypothetical protein